MLLTQIKPSDEQLKQLLAYPKDSPVVMCNIIKFNKHIKNGAETGKQAYARYIKNATPLLKQAHARIIWKGQVATTLIGDSSDEPDLIFLVEYPSTSHFMTMIGSEDYQKISIDRSLALKYGGLIACKTQKI